MARTATQRRSTSAGRRGGSAARTGARATKRAAEKTAKTVKPSAPTKMVGAAAKKALKTIAKRALNSGAGAVRAAGERTTGAGKGALETALSKRLPVQVSIDVAVPLSFAWDEWMTFEWMTEGVHNIVDVERDGDQLFGQLAGPRGGDWGADVVDEREEQSFAWRSEEGSDCAGLVTFHSLSERLTRIELDLDVLPTNPAEAATLALRIAHRRAESELRRFKAHVEFISPDVYESEEEESDQDEEFEDANEPDADEAFEDQHEPDEDEHFEDEYEADEDEDSDDEDQ